MLCVELKKRGDSNYEKSIEIFLISLISLVVVCSLAIGIFFLCVPLARTDKGVCNYVLRKIPIGTSMEAVVAIAEKESWEIREMHNERGLRINDSSGNVSVASKDEMLNGVENNRVRIVGEKAMVIKLGEFYAPFHTAVFAYLAFDENCELVEVSIRRDIDAF